MEVKFIRSRKVKTKKEVDGKVVEVEEVEKYEHPFESHPHELLSSLATRFALETTKAPNGDLVKPPPGVKLSLYDAEDGVRLADNITVKAALDEGTVSFALKIAF